MAKYIIEIEDVPSMYEDGLTYFMCVDAPWWYISDRHIKRLKPYEVAKRKMSNNEWIDFLVSQFDVSRTSAKEMLHGMMRWKKEDNFKKQFNGRRQDENEGPNDIRESAD